jgi:hypothetical protein
MQVKKPDNVTHSQPATRAGDVIQDDPDLVRARAFAKATKA